MGGAVAKFISNSFLSIRRRLGQSLRNLQFILRPPQLHEQPPPPNPDAAPAPLVDFPINNLDRPLLVLGFCFTAIYNPMIQNRNRIPIEYHLASLMLILCVSALLSSTYMSRNLEAALGLLLQYVGVFFGATAFLLNISMFFPIWLKLISWFIYALTLLGIYLSYLFY